MILQTMLEPGARFELATTGEAPMLRLPGR